MRSIPKAALIFAGGAVGSLLRWGLQTISGEHVIVVTCLINILGAGLLGLLGGLLPRQPEQQAERFRSLLGTGVLGGFTTYSAFALQVVSQQPLAAVALAAISVGGGILAAWLAVALVDSWSGERQ